MFVRLLLGGCSSSADGHAIELGGRGAGERLILALRARVMTTEIRWCRRRTALGSRDNLHRSLRMGIPQVQTNTCAHLASHISVSISIFFTANP